jgi:Ca2+-binding RTX toxin-like protein
MARAYEKASNLSGLRHKRLKLAITGTAASVVMGVSAVNGAYEQRGGNHGCDEQNREVFSSHVWEAGDRVVFGWRLEEGAKVPPTPDQDLIRAQNTSAVGEGPQVVTCGADKGRWRQVRSELGPGDDFVRLDAAGLEPDSEGPYKPIPRRIDAQLQGGSGDDVLRGHKGFDNMVGGEGSDVLKADDGVRDLVQCGPGKDKADVDSEDDVSRCEKET